MNAQNISKALIDRIHEIVPILLPKGKKAGSYWQAGDIHGTPGTSLYIKMDGEGIGNWIDAATGQRGDLLDLIAAQRSLSIKDAIPIATEMIRKNNPVSSIQGKTPKRDNTKAAISLWHRAKPINENYSKHGLKYFTSRGLTIENNINDLRFLQDAWLRVNDQKLVLPAIIACVRNASGEIIAVHRTFLDPEKPIKANIDEPKRALGGLTGGACWLRKKDPSLIVAEGLETALSLGMAFPTVSLAAGLTAHHLSVMEIPAFYNRIMIAADNDAPGKNAAKTLKENIYNEKRHIVIVSPSGDDFNDDLRANGAESMKQAILAQNK